MAEASAHKLSFVEETTRGVTPTNPRFQRLPDTRTTIALQKDTLQTERLTGTRFPAEPRTGASSVSGDIPADLSFRTYNAFIASALQGAFLAQGVAPATTASPDAAFTYGDRVAGEDVVTISVAVSANIAAPLTITLVNEGSTWATANGTIVVESIDGDEGKVVFLYDDTSTITPFEVSTLGNVVIDGEDLTVDAVVDSQRIAQAKAGDTRLSFSILREFSDFEGAAKPFLKYVGCEVTTWNLTATANGLAKSVFSFLGREGGVPELLAPTGTTYVDPIDTEPFDTFNGAMELDGSAQCIVTDYNLTINNGLAPRYTVGCSGSQDPTVGQSIVEGSITAFFEDELLYQKFVDESKLSLKLTLQDSVGNQFVVDLPNLRIVSGTQPDVSGDGSITIPINFTGHFDETLETHVGVTSIEAP